VFAQNKQKRGEGFVNIRDLNQEFLLQIPSVIKKLVDFACKQDCKCECVCVVVLTSAVT